MNFDIAPLIGTSRILLNDLREISQKLEILPLYWEMGGWYGLTRAGDVVSATWDAPEDLTIVADLRIRNVALFQGTKVYPELEPLIPKRKDSDVVCPYCSGSGIHPWADRVEVTCFCGGLGWIPDGSKGT